MKGKKAADPLTTRLTSDYLWEINGLPAIPRLCSLFWLRPVT